MNYSLQYETNLNTIKYTKAHIKNAVGWLAIHPTLQ